MKLQVKYLVQKINNLNKNIFPSTNFIFMSEEEKDKYFSKGNIKYYKNNNIIGKYFNSNQINNNNIFFCESNSINNSNKKYITNEEQSKFFATNKVIEININNYLTSKRFV